MLNSKQTILPFRGRTKYGIDCCGLWREKKQNFNINKWKHDWVKLNISRIYLCHSMPELRDLIKYLLTFGRAGVSAGGAYVTQLKGWLRATFCCRSILKTSIQVNRVTKKFKWSWVSYKNKTKQQQHFATVKVQDHLWGGNNIYSGISTSEPPWEIPSWLNSEDKPDNPAETT